MNGGLRNTAKNQRDTQFYTYNFAKSTSIYTLGEEKKNNKKHCVTTRKQLDYQIRLTVFSESNRKNANICALGKESRKETPRHSLRNSTREYSSLHYT